MPEKVSSGCLRHHPVTGQLSSLLLTMLGWRRPGKIGSANTKPRDESRGVLLCLEKCSSGCLRHHPVTGQWVGRSLLPTKGQVGALHNGRDALLRAAREETPAGINGGLRASRPMGQVRRTARRGRRPAVERSGTNALGVQRPVSAAAPRCKSPAGRGLSAQATGGVELPCDIAPSVSATRCHLPRRGRQGETDSHASARTGLE